MSSQSSYGREEGAPEAGNTGALPPAWGRGLSGKALQGRRSEQGRETLWALSKEQGEELCSRQRSASAGHSSQLQSHRH